MPLDPWSLAGALLPRKGGNAELRQQLEGPGGCPQDGGEVKSLQLPLQHKACLESLEELPMGVPYHILAVTDHSHWHFFKSVHDWGPISSTPRWRTPLIPQTHPFPWNMRPQTVHRHLLKSFGANYTVLKIFKGSDEMGQEQWVLEGGMVGCRALPASTRHPWV